MLKSIGYSNFKIVSNGQEAVEEARARKYLIILMDCMMPITSGN
jgi:CheY-like chemotaxis protein